MKRKFLASYQSITFDSFSKHTNFHTLIVSLDDIENEKQIPLKVLKTIQKHEREKYSYSDFLPDVMLINFWEIEP
jgi:uncharacterized protein Veg